MRELYERFRSVCEDPRIRVVRVQLLAAAVAALLVQGAGARPSAPAPSGQVAAFSDRGATLVVTAERYTLTLSKRNGQILALADRDSGTRLVTGQGGCLWGARAAGDPAYLGGCSFRPGGAERFSYAWDRRTGVLTLTYGGGSGLDAVATIDAEESAVDLRLTLQSTRPGVIENVLFPADLDSSADNVRAGYAPNFLPGVRLKPAFFSRIGNNVNTYPSRWAFADYLALDVGPSGLALYSINPAPSPLAPVDLGFVHTAAGDCADQMFCITHAFETWISPGQTWTSPVVRLQVGATARESILAYRYANGIDEYPSLADKLGSSLAVLAKAPLVKADLWKGLPPFREWGAGLARLPSPALVHPVAYQPRGHDENDPDFLPPDPTWGTIADFRSMIDDAHARGLLVMPYANVSWWDDGSPTLLTLPPPLTVKDVAVQDDRGEPFLERFGDHAGYVVSPYAPYVRDRVAQVLARFRSELPIDCLFLDQIGARPWVRDFNPASPTPLAYDDGWLALMAPYGDRCLMVEDGWDRLAATFAGFHGGLLLMHREHDIPNLDWGPGDWDPYPLADWLLHDKVLLYQHDLYEGTMTADPEVLTWNLAFGFQLSYSWNGLTGSLDSPWLDAAGSFERALGPHYAGVPLDAYEEPAPGVTASTFGDLRVLANWSGGAYETDGFTVAPGGFLARAPDVTAGSFAGSFAGAPLSPGTHYLIVQQGDGAVTVRQPLGDDTPVSVEPPASRGDGRTPQATAYSSAGRMLADVGGALESGRFVFDYRGTVDGEHVGYYRVS